MPEAVFDMPRVSVGTIVLWYPDGSQVMEPLAAIVTRVHVRSLCLNIFSEGNYNMMVRDGVRHIKDPDLAKENVRQDGAWGHTQLTLALDALLRKQGFSPETKEKA